MSVFVTDADAVPIGRGQPGVGTARPGRDARTSDPTIEQTDNRARGKSPTLVTGSSFSIGACALVFLHDAVSPRLFQVPANLVGFADRERPYLNAVVNAAVAKVGAANERLMAGEGVPVFVLQHVRYGVGRCLAPFRGNLHDVVHAMCAAGLCCTRSRLRGRRLGHVGWLVWRDRKSTRLNSSPEFVTRMPYSA